MSKTNCNSIEYWDNRYITKDWENHNGYEQTNFWGELMIHNLPQEVVNDIKYKNLSINDIGCACGQICNIFKEVFPNSKVIGYDYSNEAIKIARQLYPNVEFINKEIENGDCLILSNLLEHYDLDKAKELMFDYINKLNNYVIILCPFEENKNNLISEHMISIKEDFFPNEINNVKLIFNKVIDTRQSGFWHGDVIMCIYKKETINEEGVEKPKSKGGRPKKNG